MELSAYEVLTTTRSVRKRLDLNRPVSREIITECLEIALQAPTGGNTQGWHWVVVTEESTKAALADIYRTYAEPYLASPAPTYEPTDSRAERADAVRSSASYLTEHFHEVPAMVIPCIDGRLPEQVPNFIAASYYGGILPAVWSFMLALRSKGLGSAWTTLHLPGERDAADLLGIPFDQVTQVGLFPVAYTIGYDFRPAKRLPAAEVTHWEQW